MNITMKPKIKQILKIYDHDTNTNYFMFEKDGEWVTISEDEYEKQIRGE